MNIEIAAPLIILYDIFILIIPIFIDFSENLYRRVEDCWLRTEILLVGGVNLLL